MSFSAFSNTSLKYYQQVAKALDFKTVLPGSSCWVFNKEDFIGGLLSVNPTFPQLSEPHASLQNNHILFLYV